MSERSENRTSSDQVRRLSVAIRDVKNASANRDDVVVEMREAQRGRLELLAVELEPVFADVPGDASHFDFAISSGLQPRLWIDATSHVAMGRDRRVYRFVRDTRQGRIVLSESTDMKVVADHVTRYIAERIVERQRLMDGPVDVGYAGSPSKEPVFLSMMRIGAWNNFLAGLGLFLSGAAVGVAIVLALVWGRLVAFGGP